MTALTGNVRQNAHPNVTSRDNPNFNILIFFLYSSGLWSPIETASTSNFHSANSFSAFGPNNSFNLTGGNLSGSQIYEPTEEFRETVAV